MSRSVPIAASAIGAALLIVWLLPAPAQQFSADLVRMDAGGAGSRPAGKLNVSDGRVRIETSDLLEGYFLVLGDAGATYFLRPAAKVFMDAKQSSLLTQLLVAVDPDDPCRQWQAAAVIAGAAGPGAQWRCERGGDDTVSGLRTIKYRATSPQGRQHFGWIDPQLRFPVRLQMDDGAVVDVANIAAAPQPERLFAVPAAYRKFDPQQLIDRIRHSDVLVEPRQ